MPIGYSSISKTREGIHLIVYTHYTKFLEKPKLQGIENTEVHKKYEKVSNSLAWKLLNSQLKNSLNECCLSNKINTSAQFWTTSVHIRRKSLGVILQLYLTTV